jgi:hypothetical protein
VLRLVYPYPGVHIIVYSITLLYLYHILLSSSGNFNSLSRLGTAPVILTFLHPYRPRSRDWLAWTMPPLPLYLYFLP